MSCNCESQALTVDDYFIPSYMLNTSITPDFVCLGFRIFALPPALSTMTFTLRVPSMVNVAK